MAESAVNFLIEYMGRLLVDEMILLKGVRGEARKIKDELESMKAFLKDADAKEHDNEGIKTWVRQVKDAACDTEDILDEFILRIGQYDQQDGLGFLGFLHKMSHSIKQLQARHRIGREIQDLRVRISDILKRKDDYSLHSTEQVSSRNLDDGVFVPRIAALFTEESELVGIDYTKRRVIGWLLKQDGRLSVMSVAGMGGLGKTTLVKKVYDSKEMKKAFETFAWVTVSETFKKMDLLQEMIKQFYQAKQEQAPSGLDAMTDIQLIQVIKDYLQKKSFLLVADDVWGVNAWELLKLALPTQECGSRVILTMRRHDVALSCCIGPSDFIYEHQPLDLETSWSLFCRRAFPLNMGNSCPPELEELARSFVNKCRGLPLAIVTLGALLASKDQTPAVWEMMHRSLGSELENNNQLKRMKEILWLSFNELPYYLKSCFLYLGIFPEDHHIGRQLIIKLWMAEGFIEKTEGKTPEEVGESYFNALISRGLIQVSDSERGGEVFTFHIPDLLREIIISKAGEENLIVSSKEEKIAFSDRVRRLSIYNKGEMVPRCESSSHLRSFFIFGVYKPSITSAITTFTRFRLLRVVNIENVPLETFPEDLTRLLHLRYLRMFKTEIKHLPSSIGKLINLETLILEDNLICELPEEIYRLWRLRHLSIASKVVGSASNQIEGAKLLSGVGRLRYLQELRRVEVESSSFRELEKLTELRALEIIKLKTKDGHDLCTAIEKMMQLKLLEVTSREEDEEIDMHSLSLPPQNLQRLSLFGRLNKLPHWIPKLQNLLVLHLLCSRLKDDPLQALSSLPNLVQLKMSNAYDGEKLWVREGQYPKLKELWLDDLRGLKHVMMQTGAMHNVEVLVIRCCKLLVQRPWWLASFFRLRHLYLTDMPMAFLESLIDEGPTRLRERAYFIRHVPFVSHYDIQSGSTQTF